LLNFRLLWIIAARVFRDPANPSPGYFALLVPKFTAIGFCLWLIVKYQWFNIVAFAVGTMSLFLAILGVAMFRTPEKDTGELSEGAPPEANKINGE
jgi:hypothetical protein